MTSTRFETRSFDLITTVPTFLGGADQRAQWRTPPIKALFRSCWRIVVAPSVNWDWRKVRDRELPMFGHASGTAGCRSRVTFSLAGWEPGDLAALPGEQNVRHPEVANPVGSALYLGYGPLIFRQGGTHLKNPPAIGPGSSAALLLRYPTPRREEIEKTLRLVHLIGALGGRSRNGWGSVSLALDGQPLPAITQRESIEFFGSLARPLADCLREDWPHALGADDRGLLTWKTDPCDSWNALLQLLARIKIGLRTTNFKFQGNQGQATERHVLAYPVTHHNVTAWGNKRRLANQLRFKVVRENAHWRGVVVHLPTRVPGAMRDAFGPGVDRLEARVWGEVHQFLDNWPGLNRLR